MKNRIFLLFRWHKRVQLDISLGHYAQAGYLSLGWTWRDGHRPICYWSPDATPLNARAVGPWRRYGL